MKTKILILSSLLGLYGINTVHASECVDCEFEYVEQVVDNGSDFYDVQVAETGWLDNEPDVFAPEINEPGIVSAKLLTIKPVPEDKRPQLWDGTRGQYAGPDVTKTVDWRNGVPIWDDSISDYRRTDFSDWYLEPTQEIYLRDGHDQADLAIALYEQNMADAALTRARVEELLTPRKPNMNVWFADSVDNTNTAPLVQVSDTPVAPVANNTTVTTEAFVASHEVLTDFDDGCPFDSETECEIWRRKPIIHETVAPRSKTIRALNMNPLVDVLQCNTDLSANADVAKPLLERYKMLMRSAQACCSDGMVHALRSAGASDGLIYKFMVDDANFYGLSSRCLMMTDYELDTKYPNTATAVVAADVRNGCLCRNRQWFESMLAPFTQAYNAVPEFKQAKFNYTYTDGLKREITVSINNDIQNVLNQLAKCP